MCNMHTSSSNEGLTLKVGTIQIRQLLRLYPCSWLEAGSVHIPELRINAKFQCHPPTPVNMNEQIEFLRRHDQKSQRLHFLHNTRLQQWTTTTTANLKRPPTVLSSANTNLVSCACLGGSSGYYTLVQGNLFFKSSFRLSEQSSFGCSLFRSNLHVIHSHPIFEHKHSWPTYAHSFLPNEQLHESETFYPFDFCAQQKQLQQHKNCPNNNKLTSSYSLLRSDSARSAKHQSSDATQCHRRSLSSLANSIVNRSSSLIATSDTYLTPNEYLSMNNLQQQRLSNSEESSLTDIQHPLSISTYSKLRTKPLNDEETLSITSLNSSSTDSLAALEEILQRQQTECTSRSLSNKVNREVKDISN